MSRRKGANVSVKARECRGNHERMIRKFIKKCKKAKIIEQLRERKHYKKPSDVKRHRKQAAIRRQKREVLKQKAKLRARERNS
jgi:small subunit ribosomal protein S21|tara:strand:+ start:1367 stop:1615 length:249 start_codon:yes stop_codon:yes gene_type:complete